MYSMYTILAIDEPEKGGIKRGEGGEELYSFL